MTSNETKWDQPSTFRRLYVPVAVVLAVLILLLWLLGYGPGGRSCAAPAAAGASGAAGSAAATATPAPAVAPPAATASVAPATASPPTAATPAAAVAVPEMVKVYFAVGSANVSDGDKARLSAIIEHLVSHPGAKVSLSGYHDTRGQVAQNEALAHNRARAVRALLESKGIAKERVVLVRPKETTGEGPAEEARRVEVSIQP